MKNGIADWAGKFRWQRTGFGLGVALLAMLTTAAAFAGLVQREWIEMEWMRYGAALILVVSSFLGTKSAGSDVNGVAAMLGLVMALLGINLGVFGGQVEGFGVAVLPIIGGCGAALLLRGHMGSARTKRRKRRKNR